MNIWNEENVKQDYSFIELFALRILIGIIKTS